MTPETIQTEINKAADMLEADGRAPLSDEQVQAAIEYADTRWSDADVPMGWARHFANGLCAGRMGVNDAQKPTPPG